MTLERRARWKQRMLEMAETLSEVAGRIQLCGEARIDTRNTLYVLRDGVCVSVTRNDTTWSASPILLLGMRLIAWLPPPPEGNGLEFRFQPGSCAVLWRERRAGEKRAPIAITTEAIAFHEELVDTATEPDALIERPPQLSGSRPSLTRISRPSHALLLLPRRPGASR